MECSNGVKLEEEDVVIDINHLSFAYPETEVNVLQDINFQAQTGQRILLFGANGSGKSTLLRLLAGRHLFKPYEAISMLGRNPFLDTRLNLERAFMDTDWGLKTVAFGGYGVPLQADIRLRSPCYNFKCLIFM